MKQEQYFIKEVIFIIFLFDQCLKNTIIIFRRVHLYNFLKSCINLKNENLLNEYTAVLCI